MKRKLWKNENEAIGISAEVEVIATYNNLKQLRMVTGSYGSRTATSPMDMHLTPSGDCINGRDLIPAGYLPDAVSVA